MKTETTRTNRWMNAITFAEAGEWDTARRMMPPAAPQGKLARLLEKAFMAVAFAEESMHDEAIRLVTPARPSTNRMENFLDSVGLRGAPMRYGIVQATAMR